jgi:hypothetical protein
MELGGAKFILFFSSPRKKKEKNPIHIAAHLQVPRADAKNQSLQKSCNFAYAPVLNCYI